MSQEHVRTRIWQEEPEPDNPFAARVARCHGYDVFGELVGNISYTDYVYLLFRGDAPPPAASALLAALAVALANPGPRDPSVHAAMCGGVGGSTAAASLIAALAVGAGERGGSHEIVSALQLWSTYGCDLAAWRAHPAEPVPADALWPDPAAWPGFDGNAPTAPTPVRQLLARLAALEAGPHVSFLAEHRSTLEQLAGASLALPGVAAAAFADLGFSGTEAEMLYLLLRLPGAAAHAIEQTGYGFRQFPFFRIELTDDPATPDAGKQSS